MPQIVINEKIKSYLWPLSASEKSILEQSIIQSGCRDKLCLWGDMLLDGHNRYDICQRLGVAFETFQVDGISSMDEALLWVSANQRGRRNLPEARMIELVRMDAAVESRLAKERMKAGGGDKKSIKARSGVPDLAHPITDSESPVIEISRVGKTRDILAEKAGVSHTTYAKADKVYDVGTPEIQQAMRSGEMSIDKAYKHTTRMLSEEKRQKIAAEAIAEMPVRKTDRYNVFCGDISGGLPQILNESIDVIVTDPPYPQEYIPLLSDLTSLAERVLKDGGSMVVMIGQSYLPEVFRILSESTLTYRWTGCYLTGGESTDIHVRKIGSGWKPLVIFSKGSTRWSQFYDVVKSLENDKDSHHWGQSESGMSAIIEKLTLPGDMVCDPFLGAGTTGVAAVSNNRMFIGSDIDEKFVAVSAKRISEIK